MRAAILAMTVAACSPPSPYTCATSSDCEVDGMSGVCEADSFCSFSDVDCPSGRRYGAESGPLSEACVDDSITPITDERELCGVTARPATDGPCATLVCAEEPWCCDTSWDQICARTAEARCDLECGEELVAAGGFTTAAAFDLDTPRSPVWTASYYNFSYQPAWGDIEGDGKPDLAFARHSDSNTGLLLLQSNGLVGTALALTPAAIGGAPIAATSDVEWRDFDDDGDLDLLASGPSGVYLVVTEDDTFTAHHIITMPAQATWASADDAAPWKLAVVYDTTPQATVRIHTIDATYAITSTTDLGTLENSKPLWCDVAGTHERDLLVGNQLFIATATGFASPTPLVTGGYYPACADLDGDGDNDVVLGGYGTVSVLMNQGGFSSVSYAVPMVSAGGITFADFDDNGRLDVLMSNDTIERREVPLILIDNLPAGFTTRELVDWNTMDWDQKGVDAGRLPRIAPPEN